MDAITLFGFAGACALAPERATTDFAKCSMGIDSLGRTATERKERHRGSRPSTTTLTAIAVLLTALGYSLNDRIVVYDRIREEMGKYKGKPLAEIINIAVNATLLRTIVTSGVTSLSLVGLLVLGVGEIFDFSAAMLVGIVVGTYSSVYIASPLTLWMDERAARQQAKRRSPILA